MKKILFAAIAVFTFLIFGMSFSSPEKDDPSGPAYAVTWKSKSGKWYAVGPVQKTATPYKTEDEAIELVRGINSKKKGHVKFYKACGAFKVYTLGVEYSSGDKDALKYVREKKGYSCNWP